MKAATTTNKSILGTRKKEKAKRNVKFCDEMAGGQKKILAIVHSVESYKQYNTSEEKCCCKLL